jgi:hypothetical protein
MSKNGTICFGLIVAGAILVVAAILFCAMEKVSISAMIATVACALSIPGFYFGFESWRDPESGNARDVEDEGEDDAVR